MKQELQIIGADVVGPKTIKVCCMPFTTPGVKKKEASLMSMAMGGVGIQDLVREAEAKKSQKTIFYVSLEYWETVLKNRLFSKITMEVLHIDK